LSGALVRCVPEKGTPIPLRWFFDSCGIRHIRYEAYSSDDRTGAAQPVETERAELSYANVVQKGISVVFTSEDLNFLSGEVNLFVEEDYIGKSSIDNIGPGEPFDLYLWADENVRVKRKMISKEIDKTLKSFDSRQ